MSLPKAYDPKAYESDIYGKWEQSGLFAPSGRGEPYSIILPPPNATGQLHLGHVVMVAVEDCLIRYQRMRGKDVLWLPGTDHAAIATNAIMERELAKAGQTKHDIGREAFLKRLSDYIENSRDTIRSQIRAMGASLDWKRERYTMEPALNRVVSEVFIKMYQDGLIYRGQRIVNWDPNLETTVSDDELDRQEEKATFYTLRYGPFEIGTARPETKFGDKYVVMHPDDKRYAKYKHGETFEAEWINGKVKATIIKDEAVDPKFGTGVMTITPWHDTLDFEIAERHDLDRVQIIGQDGKLLPIAGEFAGMSIEQARPKIVAKLKEKGLLITAKPDYTHNIALNSRGGGVIEPQIMEQWFVDVNKKLVHWHGAKQSLKEVMQTVVDRGEVRILPSRFEKIYFNWINNLRDWCISRQIWWGHRIPAWYRTNKDGQTEVYVGSEPPTNKTKGQLIETSRGTQSDGVQGDGEKRREAYKQYEERASEPATKQHAESDGSVSDSVREQAGAVRASGEWKQDEDTLDTWFSSAMWTWSTLIDPKLAENPKATLHDLLKHSPDFGRYHPTSVLETGYDILFFWIARMILMTTYVTGQVPFHDVYLHGLVRTRDGRKMSKSHPETAIDPLEMIPKHGADALRLAMMIGQSPGHDIRLYEEKIAGQRNFCNKLWNVARYTIDKLPEGYQAREPKISTPAEHWVHVRLQKAVEGVSQALDAYRFSDGAQIIYHTLWDDFADWYIEVSKFEPNPDLLVYGLETLLKLAHPFVPFVTEAVWQALPHRNTLLIGETWPESKRYADKDGADFEQVKTVVSEIRNLRAELQLTANSLYHKGSRFLTQHADLIIKLTGIQGIHEVSSGHGLHLTSLKEEAWLDVEEQIARSYLMRLLQRRDQKLAYIQSVAKRLNDKAYLKQAPKELVNQSKEQLDLATDQMKKISKQIDSLEHELQLYG